MGLLCESGYYGLFVSVELLLHEGHVIIFVESQKPISILGSAAKIAKKKKNCLKKCHIANSWGTKSIFNANANASAIFAAEVW